MNYIILLLTRFFKVKNLPLSKKQLEICDFILKNKDNMYPDQELVNLDYDQRDISLAGVFMIEHKLLTCSRPIIFTVLGSSFINKGIVKYIKYKKLNNFLDTPILKFGVLFTSIIISLVFNVINHFDTSEVTAKNITNNKYLDSALNKQNTKLNHLTTLDLNNKVNLDSIYNILQHHESILKPDTSSIN